MPKLSNENQLNLTLQTLKRDSSLNIKRATSIYIINYTILLRRKRGQQSNHDYIPKIRNLTNLEESIIIYRIFKLDV